MKGQKKKQKGQVAQKEKKEKKNPKVKKEGQGKKNIEKLRPQANGGLVLIGQSPGKNPGEHGPLTGKSGKLMAKRMGLSFEEYLLLDRRNILTEFKGKAAKGDLFPLKEAKEEASKMIFFPGSTLVLLGKAVAGAMGIKGKKTYFVKYDIDEEKNISAFIVPHPSGINLWWNDADNRKKADAFFKDLLFTPEKEEAI